MKMKAISGKTAFLAVMFLLVSCSGYQKLLKSRDHEAKLEAAYDYYDKGVYPKTIQLLGEVIDVYTGTTKEDSLLFLLGSAAYMQEDFRSAQDVFREYRMKFARSPMVEEAEFMYTMCFYYMSPQPYRDQAATVEAIRAIDEFVSRYPNGVATEDFKVKHAELRQKLYDKALLNARVYYDIGYYNTAVVALRNAIDQWPESNHNEELNYLIVSSWYEYAKNSVAERQRERYMSMQDAYYGFIAEYPESVYRKEVDGMNEVAVNYLSRFRVDEDEETETETGAAAAAASTEAN